MLRIAATTTPVETVETVAPAKKAFIVGETYACRSIGDHNCIFKLKVTRRTAKSVWVISPYDEARGNKPKRKTVKESYNGHEAFCDGNYSFAPYFTADTTLADI